MGSVQWFGFWDAVVDWSRLNVSLIRCGFRRDAQAFVEKFEGALGKGKGRKMYAYKVMMAKVMHPHKTHDQGRGGQIFKMYNETYTPAHNYTGMISSYVLVVVPLDRSPHNRIQFFIL